MYNTYVIHLLTKFQLKVSIINYKKSVSLSVFLTHNPRNLRGRKMLEKKKVVEAQREKGGQRGAGGRRLRHD